MTFRIGEGRVFITSGGLVKFDTNDLMLHGGQSGLPIQGALSFGVLSSNSNSPVNIETAYNLGAVNGFHTTLFGAVKLTYTGAGVGVGAAFDRWTTVMGGTIVYVMDGEPGFQAAAGDNAGPYQYLGYSFRISGGQAQCVQRCFLRATPATVNIGAHTLTFKLRSGNFT